jgi:3D (Asp-Asp-Asp) domain-containing protein
VKAETRGALAVTAVLFGFMWGASALADHFIRPDSDLQAPAVASQGEGETTAGTSPVPVPASTPVRERVPVASRSRATAAPRAVTGTRLTSTAYCETGLMANGHRTHVGAVAANRWPLGTTLRVSDSPYGPGIFTVEDRYGWGTSLDFAVPGDCGTARTWGRRTVRVEVVR